ncbi:NAD(P)/FAD-dependent oxidoreductase [Xinfangfangia pollutisoli]|uniref:NAD(P)/FAD-dependent oxidoreductase n=1 Tax=Xinfangfangia pollutisoli TaxID=2865960 RepID=UPI001CD6EBDC|nr:FAD-dependent oxidoreductase [Xinfangfangia pollutisoli]
MQKTVIIGAGIIGCAIAFQLARRGHAVTVLDAGGIGAGASGRSFGWINASFHLSEAHFRLRMEGITAHHRLAAQLPDAPTSWPGTLLFETQGEALAATEADLARLGYPLQRLTRAQIEATVPALADPPAEALLFPAEGAVDPAALARCLLAASGARLWRGVAVLGLVQRAGRVTGVQTAEGVVGADAVVVAAGTGSPALLAPLGLDLPMLTRPGLMLATRPLPPALPRILVTPAGEIRQDGAGRILMPTAAGHQGDAAEDVSGLAGAHADRALAGLQALFPALALDWAEVALAFRPVPGDGLPVIGPAAPGLWLAVMHSGATLAAVAAERIAAEMDGGEDQPILAPFRLSRFARSGADFCTKNCPRP